MKFTRSPGPREGEGKHPILSSQQQDSLWPYRVLVELHLHCRFWLGDRSFIQVGLPVWYAQIFQIIQKLNNFSLPNILGLQYRGEPNTCWAVIRRSFRVMLAYQWGVVPLSCIAWWHWSQTSCMVAPVSDTGGTVHSSDACLLNADGQLVSAQPPAC